MADDSNVNVYWHDHSVSSEDRCKLNGHKGAVLWFTGLSGSGKSTIANTVDNMLHQRGVHTYVLDGDNVRHGLNASPAILKDTYDEEFSQRFGLGFSPQDREENIRRIGQVAGLFADAGMIVLTAFISPYRADRDRVRDLMESGKFVEVLVDASLETCEARDPKGLYKKARAGEIKGFTGIDAPYEAPEKPELVLDSNAKNIDDLARDVIAHLEATGYLSAS